VKPILIVIVVAVVGWLVWERHFSRDARIDTAYRTCMKSFGGEADANGSAKAPPAKGDDPAAAIAKGMSDAMTSVLQGVGGAMCGAVRDACRRDFDGSICQAALARYR
jgi:hypothetical protein